MSAIKLIVSDLHLADNTSLLDCFGARQQEAFAGLLQAFAASSLDKQEHVEFIINGDCFDFLVMQPYGESTMTDEPVALLKLERLIAAHHSFFVALHAFIQHAHHTVTFITGNHDIELCFAGVRARICQAITGTSSDARISFCAARFYRPLSNLHIEHGNYFDFWNHAIAGLWDEQGQALDREPATILLSPGTRYFQQVASEISLRYAYMDHFEPSLNTARQMALLAVLDADLLVQTADRAMSLLSYARTAQALTVARDPGQIFGAALLDFAAFSAAMHAQKSDWSAQASGEQGTELELAELLSVQQALALPTVEAIAALCDPQPYQMGEEVADGMHRLLQQEPGIRYAIAGHTHMRREEHVGGGTQVYLNTASWTTRLAVPSAAEVTPEIVAWLRRPDWDDVPLRDVTELTFALVQAQDGVATDAHLYAWEGGADGTYRQLT